MNPIGQFAAQGAADALALASSFTGSLFLRQVSNTLQNIADGDMIHPGNVVPPGEMAFIQTEKGLEFPHQKPTKK